MHKPKSMQMYTSFIYIYIYENIEGKREMHGIHYHTAIISCLTTFYRAYIERRPRLLYSISMNFFVFTRPSCIFFLVR
jgi:hypothetical protein